MFLLLRFIRKRIQEARRDPAQQQQQQQQQGNPPPAAQGEVEPHLKNFSGVTLKTREGRNLAGVMMVGFVAALDYTCTLMSIQPLYMVIQGQPDLYGLALGIYDLGLITAAPLVAFYVSKTHDFKTVFLVSMSLAIVGNIVYSLSIYFYLSTSLGTNTYILLIISRFVMGMGSVNLVAGTTYITSNTSFKARLGTMGSYQNMQSLSRLLGPLIGFCFLGLPFPTEGSSLATQLFNFYTVPGWLLMIVALIGFIVVLVLFHNEHAPSRANGNSLVEKQMPGFDFVNCDKSVGSFFSNVCTNSCIILFFGFTQNSLVSQLFGFGTSTFRVIQNQYDIWNPYVGMGAGAAGAVLIWRRLSHRPRFRAFFPTQEKQWAVLGVTLGFISSFMFIVYGSPEGTSPTGLMYTGTVLLGLGQVWAMTNLEIVFSKQITQYKRLVGSSTSTFFAIYTMTQSLTRFLGPFVSGLILPIYDFEYPNYNVPPCSFAPNSNMTGYNPNATCCFAASGFQISTCEMQNVNIWIPILTAFSFISLVLVIVYAFRLVSYDATLKEEESEEVGQPVGNERKTVEGQQQQVPPGKLEESERQGSALTVG